MNRHMETFIPAILWYALISCSPSSQQKHSEGILALNCPPHMEPFEEWLNSELQSFKESQYKTGGAWIYSQLMECKGRQGENIQDIPSLKHLHRFTRIFWRGLDEKHSLRLEIPDDDYLKNAPKGALEIPQDLKNPEFLKLLDDHLADSGQKVIGYIDQINQEKDIKNKYNRFIFRSQFLPTPDEAQTFLRLFIYVPGDKFDRFLQFGLHENKLGPLSNSISIIAILKKDIHTGLLLPKPQAWYYDYYRIRRTNTQYLSSRLQETGALENCYGCHSSALLPVYPQKESFDFEKFGGNLQKVNEVIAKYSSAEPALTNMNNFGPPLGPIENPARTEDFFQICAPELEKNSRERIHKAMACSSCHNDTIKPALRFPMASLSQLDRDSIVKVLIEDEKIMPPRSNLNQEERNALVQCLYLEYFGYENDAVGLLEQWLRGER